MSFLCHHSWFFLTFASSLDSEKKEKEKDTRPQSADIIHRLKTSVHISVSIRLWLIRPDASRQSSDVANPAAWFSEKCQLVQSVSWSPLISAATAVIMTQGGREGGIQLNLESTEAGTNSLVSQSGKEDSKKLDNNLISGLLNYSLRQLIFCPAANEIIFCFFLFPLPPLPGWLAWFSYFLWW